MKPYEIAEAQQLHLENIGKNKKVVVIFVKWKQSLYSNLENFYKPEDAALIGFFAEQKREQMPKDFEKNFDEIFWYQADYTGFEDLYSDLKEISLPELDSFLSLAITLIPTQKIRLIESEEHIMTTICILRKKYSIPGPSYEDLEPLRNKALIKQIAEKEGIPSAKFAIVNFEQVQDLEQEIEKIKTRIGKFPMFCKPVHGVGCGGSEKIEHENELRKWIHDMISTSKNAVYLVEEYVYGLEFNSAVCLLQDGTWRPLQITYFPEKGKVNVLKNSEPYPVLGDRFEDCTESFPNMDKFVEKIIQIYKPPHPHLFTVQGFQLQRNTDNYYLTEMSYRPQGQRGTMLSYMYSGVGQETALLSCHLDPNYTADPDPNRPKIYERHMWFPYKEGILRSHRELDKSAPISSELKFHWLAEPGTKLCKPQSYAHFLMCIKICHEEKNKVLDDLKWIEENWRPDIIPLVGN